jgi:hypothetical protein
VIDLPPALPTIWRSCRLNSPVTTADEQYIDALLGYDVAKAVLARSLGDAEAAVQRILGPGTP